MKKAQREQDREAKKAQKQLQTKSKALQERPKGRPPKQKKSREAPAVVSESIDKVVLVQAKTRNGRIVKKPAHFGEK